ncbi:MAG: Hsp20/alpha crystallin family protein [Vicinamibacterales bacterium]
MTIVRFDPFRELAGMQERMNRIFGEMYGRRGDDELMARGAWLPAVDIFENDRHEIVLKAEVPGVNREKLDVRVENNTLTLSGERQKDTDVKDEQFHRVERVFGTFSRSFVLPSTVDAEKVKADFRDGILTITLPAREEAKPRQIQVRVGD